MCQADGRLGDEGLRLMHLVPAPAVRLSCKDECYPDQALTVYWLKDNMRLVCVSLPVEPWLGCNSLFKSLGIFLLGAVKTIPRSTLKPKRRDQRNV